MSVGSYWQMGRGYFRDHRFMKCCADSAGIRIKGLKRNKVVRFPVSDRCNPQTNQIQSSWEWRLNNFKSVTRCVIHRQWKGTSVHTDKAEPFEKHLAVWNDHKVIAS